MVRAKHAYFGSKKVNRASYTGAHNLQNEIMDVEQITKADRQACHAIRSKGKARATLRRLSSTVPRLK